MKICIPTENDGGFGARASRHFGRAPYFTVVDTEADGVEVIAKAGCGHHRHGHGHGHGHGQGQGNGGRDFSNLAALEVEAVVCNGAGRGAVAGLRAAGIDVLTPATGTVADIRDAVRAGATRSMAVDQACGRGKHGSGRGGCGHHGHRHGHGPG